MRYLPDFAELHPDRRTVVSIADLQGKLAAELRAPLARYLRGGWALVASTVRFPDPLDAEAGDEVVSVNVLTDGEWIWSEAWAYYVELYGVEVPQEFLDHARANNFAAPELDLSIFKVVDETYAGDYEAGRTPFNEA